MSIQEHRPARSCELLRPNTRAATLPPSPVVAVVGATGAVGTEMIACLEARGFPLSRLVLLASARSAGQIRRFQGRDLRVEQMTATSLAGIDLALFSAGSTAAREFAQRAPSDTLVIDNSSAFRMDAEVPLVVPEINGSMAFEHAGIIANPNCTAVISAMALWPLHREARVRRLVASTYQAASGAGGAAMEELSAATAAYLEGRDYPPQVLPHPYAFNVFSHNDRIDPESGQNGEEIKLAQELRKIMSAPELLIGVTCVRVPVLRAHTIALTIELDRPLSPDAAREILRAAPGIEIVDDRKKNHFPMPREATGRDTILVGRLRVDSSDPSGRSLALLVAGDQLRKGAALNAVQIAELLIRPPGKARLDG